MKKGNDVGIMAKAGYCAIEVGNAFSWTMISTYLSVFYTDVVGLAPAVVSIIFLIARIWDGVNDPMMGIIAEKTNTRFGKYRPYLIFGAPLVAIFSILAFSKINASMPVMIIYAAVTYILCGMAYTAVCITQGGLVNLMTRDLNTRVQLNSLRQAGNGITGLVISAISMPLILYFGNGSTASARGYLLTTVIFSIIGAACVVFGGITCKEKVKSVQGAKAPTLGEIAKKAFTNKDILLLVLVGIFMTAGILGRFGIISYYFIYYLENPALMATVLVPYNICTIVAQTYIPLLSRKIGKKGTALFGYAVQSISLALIFFAGKSNIPLIYVGFILTGLGNVAPSILYSLTGDICDKEELETGKRSDSVVYSLVSLGTKIGMAIGGALFVALLGTIGFVANEAQTAETLVKLNGLANLAPIIFYALSAVSILLIGINDNEAKKNREILEAREKERESAKAAEIQ